MGPRAGLAPAGNRTPINLIQNIDFSDTPSILLTARGNSYSQRKNIKVIWEALNDITPTEIEIQVTLHLHPTPLQSTLGPEGVITQERLMEHDR
jgi:hypothetical protein